jgi:hypothetical protein
MSILVRLKRLGAFGVVAVVAFLTAVAIDTTGSGNSVGAAVQTIPTSICLQDDSNLNTLQFSTADGSYTFTGPGFTLSGIGTVKIKGCTVVLNDVKVDRRVQATVDLCGKKGKASAQTFNPNVVRTIIDRNTANDSCAAA